MHIVSAAILSCVESHVVSQNGARKQSLDGGQLHMTYHLKKLRLKPRASKIERERESRVVHTSSQMFWVVGVLGEPRSKSNTRTRNANSTIGG